MKQNNYIGIIFMIFFMVCGCASSQNSKIPAKSDMQIMMNDLEDISNLSQEEKLELRDLLEKYIKEIDFYCGLSKERRLESELSKIFPEETPDKDAPVILSFERYVPLDFVPPDILEKIRESCIVDEKGLRIFLSDTKKLTELDYSSFWPADVQSKRPFFQPATIPLKNGRSESYVPSVSTPGYIHYIQENGRERKVAAFIDICAERVVLTKSQVEPDGKTIELNYFIRESFPKEDSKFIVSKDYPIIRKLNKESIRKFEWKGKVSIPEGKTLIIEYYPTGDDLTEQQRRIKHLVLIVREVANL